MKNSICFLFLVCFTRMPLVSQALQIAPQTLPKAEWWVAMESKGNSVYLLGDATGTGESVLAKFNGINWEIIPTLEPNGNSIRIHTESDMIIHRDGSVWISGKDALWKYDGANWTPFRISDNFAASRKYGAMTCDSLGNIWSFSQVYSDVVQNSALLKFDGANLEIVRNSKSFYGFWGIAHYSKKRQIATRSDGTVVLHFTRSTLSDSAQPEIMFLKDGKWSYQTAETFDKTPYVKGISSLMTDENNSVIFHYTRRSETYNGQYITFGGGLSILHSDGSWKHFTSDDGLPFISVSTKSQLPLSVFSSAEDGKGNRWFGAEKSILFMENGGIIQEPDWNLLKEKSRVFVSSNGAAEGVENYLRGMWDKSVNFKPDFTSVVATTDGSIWFLVGPYVLQVVAHPTSVEEEPTKGDKGINIYPNPLPSGSVAIRIELPNPVIKASVTISDQLGKTVVRDMNLSGTDFVWNATLPPSLAAGTYTIAIHTDKGVYHTRLVINR